MFKKQQNCAADFSNAICLGKQIIEKEPKEILYKSSILDEAKNKERNKLINELKDELTNAQALYSSIADLKRIRYCLYKNKSPLETKEYIKKMILKHAANVGLNQAIKDLQRGLGILNKNRRNSLLKAKNLLLEDGIYGEKTDEALDNACKNYSLNVIKKNILNGIMANIIFDTKNNQNVDSKKLLENTIFNLKGY